MRDQIITRARMLIDRQKYDDAEKLLANQLSSDPNDLEVLHLLAELNLQKEAYEKALEYIDSAIGIAPDLAFLHYTKGKIFSDKENFNEAETCFQRAIAIEPTFADAFARIAHIKLVKKQFEESLAKADHALSLEPDNLLALNIRSSALTKLNRVEESETTIEGALYEDPNNSYTHANYGWNLLEKNDYKKAFEHFEIALQNDPNNQLAQQGMMQAIKATNPLYRVFLKYSFFMSKLTAQYQWGVIIGFYLLYRFILRVSESNPELKSILYPILGLLALLAISTWVIGPISNLFLRLHRYGKHLLERDEIRSSNFVGISFLIFIVGIVLYLVTGLGSFLALAVFGFTMMIPFSTMFLKSKPQNALLYYCIALAAVGVLAVGSSFMDGELFNPFSMLYLFGFIAFQWVANFIMIKESNY